jgi:CheY-like chemotaxis protein
MTAPPAILLAADDPAVLMHLIKEFPRRLWQPMAAKDGRQVTTALADRDLDVAIVHDVLGDMAGAELCAWLREQRPSLTIVALTSALPGQSDGDPWNVAVRFPCAPGVLRGIAVRALRPSPLRAHGRERFVQHLRAFADAMDQQDYWSLMSLEMDMDRQALRAAYDRLSLQFHPDRHPRLHGTESEELLHTVYKRIGEAYRVLSDPRKEKRYRKQHSAGAVRYDDSTRDKTGPESIEDLSENMATRRFLKLADTAHTQGDIRTAIQNLRFAHSIESDNDDIAAKLAELETIPTK